MPNAAANLEDLYDPETDFERAISQLAIRETVSEIVITRENAKEFEKPTDRLEVRFRNGEATGHKQLCPDGFSRPDAWRGQLSIQVITALRNTSENVHGKQRAQVRAFVSMLAQSKDLSDLLQFHAVNDILDTGTTPTIKSADGYEATTLTYSVHFNVRPDAWPQPQNP
jgi:hypothetical protein